MEKFFEVKGTTLEKLEKVILKVYVIPILIVAIPTIVLPNTITSMVGLILASIYLFVFYFMTQIMK